MSAAPPLWYFAYGANMAATVLARRRVQPSRSIAATLADYALRFNHPGVPPLEPVFANIEPAPGATVYGVAHQITPGEAAIFDSFEPGYRRIPVPLRLADGSTVAAFAYTTIAPGTPAIPSARYLGLLIAGAQAYSLPADLIAAWEALRIGASPTSQTAPPAAHLQALRTPGPDNHLPADLLRTWKPPPEDN
ncbi:MAG: gamma-glutamylcyclotransferase [Chloroflexota bacterium]|nr:gamma-glutamylcyclotransferase [Chloroflexota bacterium]